MGLTRAQFNGLVRPITKDRVAKDPKGFSHVEAWDIRRHLIRLFGFGGWDFTVVTCECIAEWTHPPVNPNADPKHPDAKPRYSIGYRVIGRLTVRTADGETLCVYEDGATGDAMNQPSFGDAHDMALKTALSQALKRCAANLGDQFGLSLYNNGSADAVVLGSYVSPVKEASGDSADDAERGGDPAGADGAGSGNDGGPASGGGPGRDGETSGVRPGVQPGVHRGGGGDGAAQASRGGRGAPATAGR